MTEPNFTDELATSTAASEPKTRSRTGFRGRRAERVQEESSVVQRPSTVIFQASPTTISASLAKVGGDTTDPVIVWGPGTARPADGTPLTKDLAAATPVFIVGAGPDERDFLRLLLNSHPNLSSAPESPLLAELANSVRANQDSLVYEGYPEQYWYKSAGEQFAAVQASRAASEHKARWVTLVDASELPLDTLDRMFPTARIVHVVSEGWSRRTVRTLRGQATRLSGGRYLEVPARDLETHPEGVKRAVLEFLGEPLST
jgi:hypothetical protein